MSYTTNYDEKRFHRGRSPMGAFSHMVAAYPGVVATAQVYIDPRGSMSLDPSTLKLDPEEHEVRTALVLAEMTDAAHRAVPPKLPLGYYRKKDPRPGDCTGFTLLDVVKIPDQFRWVAVAQLPNGSVRLFDPFDFVGDTPLYYHRPL